MKNRSFTVQKELNPSIRAIKRVPKANVDKKRPYSQETVGARDKSRIPNETQVLVVAAMSGAKACFILTLSEILITIIHAVQTKFTFMNNIFTDELAIGWCCDRNPMKLLPSY